MGELAPFTQNKPPKTQAERARDAQRLLQAETEILETERAYAEAISIDHRLYRETMDMAPKQRALHLATHLPSAEHLDRVAEDLEAAAAAAPNADQTLALLSLADEATKRPDQQPATVKLVVAAHDLTDMGFSPFVVALALRECRRTGKFAPSISEMIEAANLALHGGPKEDDYAHPGIKRRAGRLRLMANRKREAIATISRVERSDRLRT